MFHMVPWGSVAKKDHIAVPTCETTCFRLFMVEFGLSDHENLGQPLKVKYVETECRICACSDSFLTESLKTAGSMSMICSSENGDICNV